MQAVSGILGGMFGLESPAALENSVWPPFLSCRPQYFLSVRCALFALILARKIRRAWLPSYLAPSLRVPFAEGHVPVSFYPVDDRLRVSELEWIDEIRPGDLVLAIHYFGFANSTFPAEEVAARGALLVEDSSQALFLPQQFPESVCVLYSPPKFLGVPDSAIMASAGETGTESLKLDAPPLAWWRAALDASLARREFDLTGRKIDFFSKFQCAESQIPTGAFRSSDLSRALLHGVDYAAIRKRRRANYAKLLDLAQEFALIPRLSQEAVPLGFPVCIPGRMRNDVLRHLHAKYIYAAVHWLVHGVPERFESSHRLAAGVITLICDQRCTPGDLEREAREFVWALDRNR